MSSRRPRIALWLSFSIGGLLALALEEPWARSRRRAMGWEGPSSSPALLEVAASASPGAIEALVAQAALRHQIDPALVAAVIFAESGNNPGAVSEKGAVGLMQILPETAAQLGFPRAADPAQNLEAGCRYLSELLASFGGDVELAVAAYNAGPGAIRRWGTVPPYRETRTFVHRVAAAYRLLTGLDLQYATRFTSDASRLF
jgi:soluble lytic murein transglycosylase-like protein